MDIDDIYSLTRDMFKKANFWLSLSILVINGLFVSSISDSDPYNSRWSFGGPVKTDLDTATSLDFQSSTFETSVSQSEKGDTSFVYLEDGSAVGASHTYSNVIPTRQGLMKYKVGKGDTLSEI